MLPGEKVINNLHVGSQVNPRLSRRLCRQDKGNTSSVSLPRDRGPGRSKSFGSWNPGFSTLMMLELTVLKSQNAQFEMHLRDHALPLSHYLSHIPTNFIPLYSNNLMILSHFPYTYISCCTP